MTAAPARVDHHARLLARAAADPAFRQALLTDAKAAIERELGVTIPDGTQIVVLEESASVHYLVLPLSANRELSDAELDRVSGGSRRDDVVSSKTSGKQHAAADALIRG